MVGKSSIQFNQARV
uniref:Uncharacterized protein n=1 Tax=Anguilla anguilla TaxID=7936 RepID=A0A0E9QLG7_ANGAN